MSHHTLYNFPSAQIVPVKGPTATASPHSDRSLYWFGAVKYSIGGLDFSANDIEHGVLRANAASPTSVGSLLGRPDWARGQFRANDRRLPLVRGP